MDKNGNSSLTASAPVRIRFSEVDSMNIVWHGSYPLYFEDAREAFGAKYGIGYMDIFNAGYYAPLVELSFKYKSPIVYGMPCRADIRYVPTPAAKLIFDYEIRNSDTGDLLATGRSVQVFLDADHRLVWESPEFYEKWKMRWNQER